VTEKRKKIDDNIILYIKIKKLFFKKNVVLEKNLLLKECSFK
jgi:hypothetical protein